MKYHLSFQIHGTVKVDDLRTFEFILLHACYVNWDTLFSYVLLSRCNKSALLCAHSQVSGNGWAEGECKGKAGWFPYEYIERRERVPASKIAQIF